MDLKKIQKMIADVMDVDPEKITMDTTFVDDLGADSLDVFEIIMKIEDEYNVEVPEEMAEKIVTVGDAVNMLQSMTSAK